MKNFTFLKIHYLLTILLSCLWYGRSIAGSAVVINQAPVINYERLDNHYPYDWKSVFEIGKEAVIRFEISDPDPGAVVNFDWKNESGNLIFINATFSPALPHTGTAPYTVELLWTPTPQETNIDHYIVFTATDQFGAKKEFIFWPYPYFLAEFWPPTTPVKVAVGDKFFFPILFTDNGDRWEDPVFTSSTFRNDFFEGYDWAWTDDELTPLGNKIYYVNFFPSPGKTPTAAQIGLHTVTVSQLDQPLWRPYIYASAQFTVEVDPNCSNKYWYRDKDGDGYGVGPARAYTCSQLEGYVDNDLDCNDTNTAIGAMKTWYADVDGDGYGNALESVQACEQPDGYVFIAEDCDPTDAGVHPGADEVWGDGKDNNCNGTDDEDMACLAEQPLKLWAVCSYMASQRRWQIVNPNACAVEVKWEVHKTNHKSKLLAPAGVSYFTTPASPKGSNVVFIHWMDANGKMKQKGMSSNAAGCKEKKNVTTTTIAEAAHETDTGGVALFPMPFQDQLYLAYQGIHKEVAVKVALISLEGKVLDISPMITQQSEGLLILNLRSLNIYTGLYLLKVEIKGQEPIFRKVLKQN